MPEAIACIERLTVAEDEEGAPPVFVGTRGGMLEMPFVDDAARGKGIGSALVRHEIDALGVRVVNANE